MASTTAATTTTPPPGSATATAVSAKSSSKGKSSQHSSTTTFVLELVAGAVSGIVTKTATAPLERVKILLQLQGMTVKKKLVEETGGELKTKIPTSSLKYRGIWHTLITVLKDEGIKGWFKGNGANVVRVVPVYALKFAFNDTFKEMFHTPGKPLTFFQLMMSGTLAGLFQQCATYPLETVRTRLTLGVLSQHKYHGIIDALVQTVKHEGVRGLYKGLGPTILTGSPYVGLQMTFYEELNRNAPRFEDKYANQAMKLFNGAMAGIVAQTLTYVSAFSLVHHY